MLLIEPNKAAGLLKLTHDKTRYLQIGRGVANEDAARGAVFFTLFFVHSIRLADRRGGEAQQLTKLENDAAATPVVAQRKALYDRIQDIDRGTLSPADARARIETRLRDLAIERAKRA